MQVRLKARVAFVRVGTLEDPDRLPPDIHIFTASKQPWVVLPAGELRRSAEILDDSDTVLARGEPGTPQGAAAADAP